MKVSIVIPTYKRPDYLDRLLKSIKNQTFKEFEVIVIDDNSPNYDEYERIINKYSIVFEEFKFLRNDENKGAPHSRNKGITEAKYDLVALVDDDDEWLPLKLEKQIELFKKSTDKVGVVYTWTDVINENRDVMHEYRSNLEGFLKKEILEDCFIPSPSVMVRKKAILDAGLFDERFPSCQDWDMWTRIIFKGYEVKVVKEVVTLYNKHSGESIGLSKNANIGYLMYYKKHLIKCIKCSSMTTLYKIIKFILHKTLVK